MNEKTVKIKKQSHSFKGYASSYNVGVLNSFNPELQIKGTESATKNKLKDLFSELKDLNFVTTLLFTVKKNTKEYKMYKAMAKPYIATFTQTKK